MELYNMFWLINILKYILINDTEENDHNIEHEALKKKRVDKEEQEQEGKEEEPSRFTRQEWENERNRRWKKNTPPLWVP